MSDFQLDTSGFVENLDRATQDHDGTRWPDISPFEQGYGTAAARELYERLIREPWTPEAASAVVAFSNWAPETLAAIRKDCAAYERQGRAVGLWTGTAEQGAAFWRWRPHSRDSAFPPRTPTLNGTGKLVFE